MQEVLAKELQGGKDALATMSARGSLDAGKKRPRQEGTEGSLSDLLSLSVTPSRQTMGP